jgi:Fe-S-cluster-containing hydrogenase component 2
MIAFDPWSRPGGEIRPGLCVDCHACRDECPQEAIAYEPDRGAYNICDLCDGRPECVLWCPEGALSVAAAG